MGDGDGLVVLGDGDGLVVLGDGDGLVVLGDGDGLVVLGDGDGLVGVGLPDGRGDGPGAVVGLPVGPSEGFGTSSSNDPLGPGFGTTAGVMCPRGDDVCVAGTGSDGAGCCRNWLPSDTAAGSGPAM